MRPDQGLYDSRDRDDPARHQLIGTAAAEPKVISREFRLNKGCVQITPSLYVTGTDQATVSDFKLEVLPAELRTELPYYGGNPFCSRRRSSRRRHFAESPPSLRRRQQSVRAKAYITPATGATVFKNF